jgi:hypothetical protein
LTTGTASQPLSPLWAPFKLRYLSLINPILAYKKAFQTLILMQGQVPFPTVMVCPNKPFGSALVGTILKTLTPEEERFIQLEAHKELLISLDHSIRLIVSSSHSSPTKASLKHFKNKTFPHSRA